jgi:ribosomal protein S17E
MPAKNHLNRELIEKLQKSLKEQENGDNREIILILLLVKNGKTQNKIAEFVGGSVN